jgi:formate C-acetyltransferase
MEATADIVTFVHQRQDTPRVVDLRRRVRDAMDQPSEDYVFPDHIAAEYLGEPLPVRKARALALKLSLMPVELWRGQLFAGSMTLEEPRLHYERGFPDYTTADERQRAAAEGLSIRSVFGHIVPDYPRLLQQGLAGILAEARAQRILAQNPDEVAFLQSVEIALQAVCDYAERLADHCGREVLACFECGGGDPDRAAELREMAANLRAIVAGPAQTFWQALQAVWLLHMIFHSTMNGNAMGRLDQYAWPLLEADLAAGRLTLAEAAELVDCFCCKFNERAKTTEDQRPEARAEDQDRPNDPIRHHASSQFGTARDRVDATNHWLQNIVVGGLTPDGRDGTNPLSYLLLDSYRRNQMTNPLLTVRLHRGSPDTLVRYACEVLKEGGGMPALFNDEQLVPAIERLGIPLSHARDYTNDGCWETIIPGRTDFRFQRISMALCLEWTLNHGLSRVTGAQDGLDVGDPAAWTAFAQVWEAFEAQVDCLVGRVASGVVQDLNNRASIAPVPLLSALIDGPLAARRDLTAGGSRFRTYGMLAESAAHTIDSLVAIQQVVFVDRLATMADLVAALDADYQGYEWLRALLLTAPKYGNDDPVADAMGQRLIATFTAAVNRHAAGHEQEVLFAPGVGTFSWYIGIGQGLGALPDGRLYGEPVSSNFSPALGRDLHGQPGAILSYAKMHNHNLPAGGPLDLRLNRHLVQGDEGTDRMIGLVRAFVDTGGNMMTLTVVDTEELRAAQLDPESYRSLRVRMGGWCAYFTMLSHQQQEHHIRRQEGRS